MGCRATIRWRQLAVALVIAAVGVVPAVVALRPLGDSDTPSQGDGSGIDWSNPVPLPDRERRDYRSEFVDAEKGYRFWPISGQADPMVAYIFDTGHCGLDFLADFDGSFWRPLAPGDEEPLFFYNQDVGAVALLDEDTARYRSSTGIEVELERADGPVVTQLCA